MLNLSMDDETLEPEWDKKYVQMLDALIEYLDNIGQREVTTFNQRDITIIQALIEFYDFEVVDKLDIIDIMDDVKIRVSQLDEEEKH
jgi:hypothetical protein